MGWSPALVVRYLITQALVIGLAGGITGAFGVVLLSGVLHASSEAAELAASIALAATVAAAAAAAAGPALLALRAIPAAVLRSE